MYNDLWVLGFFFSLNLILNENLCGKSKPIKLAQTDNKNIPISKRS